MEGARVASLAVGNVADDLRHYARDIPRMLAPYFVEDERQQNALLCFCSIFASPGS